MIVPVLGPPANEYPGNNRDAERYVPRHVVVQYAKHYGGARGRRYGNNQTRYKIAFALPGQIALGKISTGETGDPRCERYVAWMQDL